MVKLKEELPNFLDFFDQEDDVKVEKFEEAINEAMKFSEIMQDKAANGSEEEKKQIQEYLDDMRAKLEEEKNKLFEKIGISQEELKAFIENKDNFTEEEWQSMQQVKQYVKDQAEDALKVNNNTVKPKRRKAKANWIQS